MFAAFGWYHYKNENKKIVRTLQNARKQRNYRQIFNRKSISRTITHPQSFFDIEKDYRRIKPTFQNCCRQINKVEYIQSSPSTQNSNLLQDCYKSTFLFKQLIVMQFKLLPICGVKLDYVGFHVLQSNQWCLDDMVNLEQFDETAL